MTRYPRSAPFNVARHRLARVLWVLAVASSGSAICIAQSANPAASAASRPSVATPVASSPRPLASKPHTGPRAPASTGWTELTPPQQQALKPLQANWGSLSEGQKRKWLAVSQNYPKMAPSEQATLHSRMTEWAGLSARQRNEARLNFAEVKQHSPDEKKAKWEAYQALSADEKQKLAAGAKAKPLGAAPAVKPVPPQKLAVVPAGQPAQKHPSIAGASGKLDHNTLLPQSIPVSVDTPLQSN
ncbi:hypothetical protein BH11PSE7_BH11PSE7_05440 [soil metagenome]